MVLKRIEIVKKQLSIMSIDHGITAGELSDNLGLSRANVSSDLNKLCEMGEAQKYGSRPIYYKISSDSVQTNAESMLDVFVHNNRSLFHCVEQAKAAILYPPHGMHMLLLGETGVGKSMFAELIYKYALEKGCFTDGAHFVVFNCADYADTPQLLLSQLMGTKKGAYTGADADRPGLLEKADGSILFLDEVHRLPPQGQEMLFSFIDKGIYRRLGETEIERKATVLLICATTENPDSTLLKTFVRRIPMIIKIPSLSEKSIDERLNLISGFFRNESALLLKPISVSINSMRSLLSYHCPNNIGQLKNDIQIICAKAYSDYVSGKKKDLRIVSFDLPSNIKEGLYLETTHRQIWNRFIGINTRYCVFDSSEKELLFQNNEDAENIYEMIDTRMQELKEIGVSDEEINKEINNDIHLYFEKYNQLSNHAQDFSSVENLVGMDVIHTVDKILAYVEEKLNRKFESNIRYGMAVHIFNSINRVTRGRKIINPQLNSIRKAHADEFSAALESLKIINQEFDIEMPIDEAAFLAVFFNLNQLISSEYHSKVRVVIIAHGATTATSMAGAANRLLGMDYAVGIDASLDENPQKVYLRLKEYLKDNPAQAGLLLLVDMGSLTNYSSDLQNELGIQVKTIPLVSTLHVIEAVRKAAFGYPLDYVYQETLHVNELLSEVDSTVSIENKLSKMFILTICTTGEGSAQLLKNTLDSQLDYYDDICETVALKLTDTDNIYAQLNAVGHVGKILCVASTFQINLEVPHFKITDVLNGKAIPKIQELIDNQAVFEKIGQTLVDVLTNINGKTVVHDIRNVIEKIETKIGYTLTSDVLTGVICHMGCMIDRLKGNQPVSEFFEKDNFINNNKQMFNCVKESCGVLEQKFNISIPDDEFCNITSFFMVESSTK